jgi:hypothetical protein
MPYAACADVRKDGAWTFWHPARSPSRAFSACCAGPLVVEALEVAKLQPAKQLIPTPVPRCCLEQCEVPCRRARGQTGYQCDVEKTEIQSSGIFLSSGRTRVPRSDQNGPVQRECTHPYTITAQRIRVAEFSSPPRRSRVPVVPCGSALAPTLSPVLEPKRWLPPAGRIP